LKGVNERWGGSYDQSAAFSVEEPTKASPPTAPAAAADDDDDDEELAAPRPRAGF
jgi:hypothetical protein